MRRNIIVKDNLSLTGKMTVISECVSGIGLEVGELKSGDKADTHCTVKGGIVNIAYVMV